MSFNKIEDTKLQSGLAYCTVVRKNAYGWDWNPCQQQLETYTGFEVAAVLQTLSTQGRRMTTLPALRSSSVNATILFHPIF